jgi:uncharacterized membrane protein
MDDEEKKFARIQTDVQIWLAACIGFVALAGAFIIAQSQSVGFKEQVFFWLSITFAILTLIGVIGLYFSRKKMNDPIIGDDM